MKGSRAPEVVALEYLTYFGLAYQLTTFIRDPLFLAIVARLTDDAKERADAGAALLRAAMGAEP